MVKITESDFNVAAETEPGYGQMFAVLMRRRFWVIGILCSSLLVATIITLITKPTYKSSMQLLIEPNYQGRKDQGNIPGDQFVDSDVEIDYATQVNVLGSPLLLQNVVNLLKPEYPTLTVGQLQSSLVLTPVTQDKVNTKILQAVYLDENPAKTRQVLGTLYRVYQIYNRQQQEQRLSKSLTFINEQIPQVQKLVEQSDAQLQKFRNNQNLIDPEQQATVIAQTLNTVEQERQAIHAQYRDNQARYIDLQRQLAHSPQKALISTRLSQSQRYQALLNELQKTELALAQRRVVFKDSDPQVQQLLAQSQSERALLQAEGGRVLGEDATQLTSTGENLLNEGQFGTIEQNLTGQLLEVQTNLDSLRARDASLAGNEQHLRDQLNQLPALIAEYNRLVPLVKINRERLEQLLKAKQEFSLEIARGGFDLQALELPQLGKKVGPSLKINLLLGLVVGLMLGGAAAFLRETLDDAVRTSDELANLVALPLLGEMPKVPNLKANELSISLPSGNPKSLSPWTIKVTDWPLSWQAVDLIYKNIQLLNSSSFASLTVTSAVAGEGKTTLSLALALSAARLHQRVLLIDADLRRPHLHQLLKLPNQQGLSTLLTNDVSLPVKSSIQSSDAYIDILTAGPIPEDPAHLLSSPRMWELMALFKQSYDLVLIDSPPILGMPDAILAASLCSGVVLVSRMGAVTKTELTHATAALNRLNVIGVIANEATGSSSSYSYTAYSRQPKVALPERLREVAKSF
ncbi:MAG: polysaccharide biosynthesis tyrosine autokinase [Chroococcidiopsidaceae cyanobacterium CP_BM_ER_R8_30]|nr:polysaccharide biosynthesis tyrosine autokinase [Chroococcidiopsidaceae cyanobacterium CP_BM_ER_R8_30]